ncbi:MAG TPA: porin family protein [Caulobacteraceae bacterium]|nr:porin family protein [Caulobacteraceae bacterium]
MKALVIAASVAALPLAAIPVAAAAQSASTFSPVTVYGALGYAGSSTDGADLGAIQGRLGARFGEYVGVEGELAGGVKNDHVNIGGTDTSIHLRHQEAAYGVGFVPITPKLDLIGRVGYGHSDIKASGPGYSVSGGADSWNYGAGAQYFVDNNNGVRVDYTRHSFLHSDAAADVWSLGYVRKF